MMDFKNNKPPYYLHKVIKGQLGKGVKTIKKYDQDRVILITGREGSGKSTLAMQCAYEVDPTFTIDDICFNAEEFKKRVRESKKFKAIVFDEAFNGLSSKGALTIENKKLIRLLQECRQRNLFLFIVLPTIFLLEIYVSVLRSNYLLHCAMNKRNPSERYIKFYNFHNKQLLFILGKKMMSYNRPKIKLKYNFGGKFPPSIVKEEYNTKKLKSFRDEEKKEVEIPKFKVQRDFALQKLYQYTTMTHKQISEVLKSCKFPMERTNVTLICKKLQRIPEYPKKLSKVRR